MRVQGTPSEHNEIKRTHGKCKRNTHRQQCFFVSNRLLDKFTSLTMISHQFGSATGTAQKSNFSVKDFFIKCDRIRRKWWIWSHLLKKSIMENVNFCAM